MTTLRALLGLLFVVAVTGCGQDVSGPERIVAEGAAFSTIIATSATSSDANIATATISDDGTSVDIKCVGSGTATITITWKEYHNNQLIGTYTTTHQKTCHVQGGGG